MNNQNIIVYQFNFLYKILKEIEKEIHFKIISISNEKLLKNEIKNLNNYIIITNKKVLKFNNQFILNQLPINLFKMIEKKPKLPSAKELSENIPSRSAKLRYVIKKKDFYNFETDILEEFDHLIKIENFGNNL